MSKCASHGLYQGEGNCPKCDPDMTGILELSIKQVEQRKANKG
jgi:hypothetical protein